MTDARSRDVLVTGFGIVSPFGFGVEQFWRNLLRGECAIGDFAVFDHARHRTHVAGSVSEFVGPAGRFASRADSFALAAAREAIGDATLDLRRIAERTGVFFGSSTGGLLESEQWFTAVRDGRPHSLRRLRSQQNNGPGDAVARSLGISGPVETSSSACTSAAVAVCAAVDAIRSGEIDVAIAGGADALCQVTYAGFNSLRSVDAAPCRPFRADRQGLSLGEGAGVLVLERGEHTRARSGRARGAIAGVATTADAWHMSAPEPGGRGVAEAMRIALADAGTDPDEVDFVNAHGTGTPHNDAAEAAALVAVFGERASRLPLCATKAAIGHSLGSCGALEAIAALLTLERGILVPTPGDGTVDPALGVDLVLSRRDLPLRLGLSINLAFGGTNSALVLRAPHEGDP
jgi:3-oxoacyl-(acyl-carrier-protein) synthase